MTDDPSQEFPSSAERGTGIGALRLLPWASPDGKPCYLDSDGHNSFLSQLADNVEAEMTRAAEDVLVKAEEVLSDPRADSRALRLALVRTTHSLSNVLRIAQSREARLPDPEESEPTDGRDEEGPTLPAEAFG
ncbi:hypothetical protein ACFYTG_30335 [Streptomyces mirabilis]|uniref:hypothetical protein n=1 Tax=Streptomyces mirabilis TaxID=68239 RepID=UPI00369CC6B5